MRALPALLINIELFNRNSWLCFEQNMSSSFRRLAKDHLSLRKGLPPNYLFEDADTATSLPDDLTQLIICLTGADDTPYAQGLWRLHLTIPSDYPKSPPKATFKTRIFHPNVDEDTGAICLETLKRDWDPKLTLKDILVTISCLLIHPNPDSALNAKAGSLIQEDYEGFSRQAKLMTSIHASIPKHLKALVAEAKRRGDDAKVTSVALASAQPLQLIPGNARAGDDLKENDQGPDRNSHTGGKHSLGKRALSDTCDTSEEQETQKCCAATQRGVVDNGSEPPRKSPKHDHSDSPGQREVPVDESTGKVIDAPGKKLASEGPEQALVRTNNSPNRTRSRQASNNGSAALRSKARIGIRRL